MENDKIKIVSWDASKIIRKSNLCDSQNANISLRDKKGQPIRDEFNGYLDHSLETDKLSEVYDKHRKAFQDKAFLLEIKDEKYAVSPYIINLSFKYVCREFDCFPGENGNRYVRFGYEIKPGEMVDHRIVRHTPTGDLLIAIETFSKDSEQYDSVSDPIENALLCGYFKYDAQNKCYTRTTVDIPYINIDGIKTDQIGIRKMLYKSGFDCDGIHYVRYKRSAGSSREGHCLFIAEPLYEDMIEWSRCGLPSEIAEFDRVSWEAYISLTLSSMQDVLSLPKNAFLILEDREEKVNEVAVNVKANEDKTLTANEEETTVTNSIWDGEGLIDTSVFDELDKKDPEHKFKYADRGMLLLRNRFFKTCVFRTRLQDWFRDNGITKIGQLNGYTTAKDISQIKIVVTKSSIKYFKLCGGERKFEDVAEEYLKNLYDGSHQSVFGIVKTDKPTHFMDGDMVRTSYQLLNTLGFTENEVNELYAPSLEYLAKIKDDPLYMRHYLHSYIIEIPDFLSENEDNYDEENDVEISANNYSAQAVMKLLRLRDDFAKTEFYKDFKHTVSDSFRRRIQRGKIQIDGTYATIFGNGAELLSETLKPKWRKIKLTELIGNEIYTKKFPNGAKLLCARSPHITMGNLLLSVNTVRETYVKYFDLSEEIVCVNAIGNNIQQRLNGCDYDSDTMLITDHPLMVSVAERDSNKFLVPVCTIQPEKLRLSVDEIDQLIADNEIGSIVNLSQYLNSLYWDKVEDDPQGAKIIYRDICQLAVLSGMEIDKAKRKYPVDIPKVIEALEKKYKKNFVPPKFYASMTGSKAKNTVDLPMKTTMSYVYYLVKEGTGTTSYVHTVPILDLVDIPGDSSTPDEKRYAKQIREYVKETQRKIQYWQLLLRNKNGDGIMLRNNITAELASCLSFVRQKMKTDAVLKILLKNIDKPKPGQELSKSSNLLLACICLESNCRFLKKITADATPMFNLVRNQFEDEDVDDVIYGYRHHREMIPNRRLFDN